MAKPTRLTPEMIEEYTARGYWDQKGIIDILKGNVVKFPDREALVDSERRLTWTELDRATDAVAMGLVKKGMKRDQAIVAQLPITGISVILLLACHKAGIICCLTPLTFRFNEMKHVVETLGATAVLTPVQLRGTGYFSTAKEIARHLRQLKLLCVLSEEPPLEAIPFRELMETSFDEQEAEGFLKGQAFGPFEVSSVVLSSGTTGMPKCIEHTGASSRAGGWGIVERAKLTSDDIVGIIAPLSGGPGLQNFWAAFQAGAKICLLERFTPEDALAFIERERVTYLPAIPTQVIRIVKECDLSRYDLSSLRAVRTGAAAFDAAMARETEEKMKCKVLIAGGSQETYSFAQSGVDDPKVKRIATLGKPFPGNEVRIVNEEGREVPLGTVGQLCVRGASTSSGYFGDIEATLAAWATLGMEGWYKTGDMAKLDQEGYLSIVGRKKDMIIRGGQNIYPGEIENLLLSHPKVFQAVIIAIPDPVMGERGCACVVCVPGETFTWEEMTSFLREKGLAVHKLPEHLEIMDRFPQLVDGQKVDKISLKRMITKKIESED
jgi:non-ribosomal peptide synthetase component E (peptide arylation enzyme)